MLLENFVSALFWDLIIIFFVFCGNDYLESKVAEISPGS